MTTNLRILLAIIWSVLATTAGGFACGLAVDRYGELGSISIWAVGGLTGFVAHGILNGPSRLVGSVLVLCCIGTLVITETCWIHWNTKLGVESWLASFKLLPTFVQEYEWSAMIGALFTAFGSWSAYRQTALGYPVSQVAKQNESTE